MSTAETCKIYLVRKKIRRLLQHQISQYCWKNECFRCVHDTHTPPRPPLFFSCYTVWRSHHTPEKKAKKEKIEVVQSKNGQNI